MSIERIRLRITGQVQGVGFRPFIYNLATRLGLSGFVANSTEGAIVELEAEPDKIEEFRQEMIRSLPPLARIRSIEAERIMPCGCSGFEIKGSFVSKKVAADVTVDTAVCDDCLRELFDPANRRYRYPFINCTNCGPRYTITEDLPYDRPNTTMKIFEMCSDCRAEYEDPTNRRFHAQPIACWKCGPHLYLQLPTGERLDSDPIETTVEYIKDGRIVAIKGIGGFHLAVDAKNTDAVERLRRLKKRDRKPFAIMVKDLNYAERISYLDPASKDLLVDISRPIVIVPKREPSEISAAVAPRIDTLGIMLPYAPYHYLLFEEGVDVIVMTSGNITDEPIAFDNEEAFSRLASVVDLFLMHTRPIYRGIDDSVVLAGDHGRHIMIRRSRGFVPQSIDLGKDPEMHMLAVGPELKNTIAIAKDRWAIVSEHIGDLKEPASYDRFIGIIDKLCGLYKIRPDVIIADLHNDYFSTRYALDRLDCGLVRVQHHHAHIVSCMVENGLDEKVIGISADGVGMGDDGTIWGCEIFVADRYEYVRVGHLKHFALPGGDAASKQLFRPALSLLYNVFGQEGLLNHPVAKRICPDSTTRRLVIEMIEKRINSPLTSSLGRVFDAVANIIGLAHFNYYEAYGPMLLESCLKGKTSDVYPYEIHKEGDRFIILPEGTIKGILADLDEGLEVDIISDKFHNTVAAFLVDVAKRISEKHNINKVVISGGCFVNKRLTSKVFELLEKEGLLCYSHRLIPPNDGGISLGQLAIGIEKAKRGEVI